MSLTILYLSKGLAFLQTLLIKAVLHIHFSATAPGNHSGHATNDLIAAGMKDYVYSLAKVKFTVEMTWLFHPIASRVEKINTTKNLLV